MSTFYSIFFDKKFSFQLFTLAVFKSLAYSYYIHNQHLHFAADVL